MKAWPLSNILQHTHIAAGLVLLLFGVATIADPLLMQHYGMTLDDANARTAIRAIVGGGEVGIGLSMLLGRRFGITARALNSVAAVLFFSVSMVRLVSTFFDPSFENVSQPWREGWFELAFAVVAMVAVFASRKVDGQPKT